MSKIYRARNFLTSIGLFQSLKKMNIIVPLVGLLVVILQGSLCLAGSFSLGGTAGVGGAAAASLGSGANCEDTYTSATNKIAQEIQKDAERREKNYPSKDGELNFDECLQGIYQSGSYPGFPKLPTMQDMVSTLCREVRREIGTLPQVTKMPDLGTISLWGGNTTLPWDDSLNAEIADALR
ncbi:MAG: hypothetical protein LBF22_14915 [Deltaproteobacteria bacterium]|nr:hypothetical protein [Deltaproteobacteria bacterium]